VRKEDGGRVMKNKVDLIDDEVPVYKKKSKKKGRPRSDHKHTYETVLLTRYYHFNLGEPRTSEYKQPTRVCTVCGRIDGVDYDASLYDVHPDTNIKWAFVKDLSEKALSLPKWYVDDFDKFAIKGENET
jgi:hypothetical protein